jgi:ribosome maturation factor RimP
MTDRDKIERLVKDFISDTDLFLVAVRVSSSNKITVLADKNDGITIDECVALHRHVEKSLDRDVEDFELQVSSPGLDMPFAVIEQYYKNEGQKVTVVTNEGDKYNGILKNVSKGGFDLETEVKVKGKAKENKDVSFNFDQIKSTKVILTIKYQ